jgi:glycosyltransferase involved in cell wall biosynthesis
VTARSTFKSAKVGAEDPTPAPANGRRLAVVLWNGALGGAESFSVTLAECLCSLGANVQVVFVAEPHPLSERLCSAGVRYRSLGFTRGRAAAWHPRRFASEIAGVGSDGALLVERGFMGAALRAGGYRGPIVAIEHGSLLAMPSIWLPRRCRLRIAGVGGAWANDAEVAVSDFMLKEMRRYPHAQNIQRIYNGIDPSHYVSTSPRIRAEDGALVVAFAGRLIAGKGADRLIEAVAQIHPKHPIKLLIAGEGAERSRLESLAHSCGVVDVVDFVGQLQDMPSFWQACDVAVIPSEQCTESFSMTTLESMACGKPVVATRNGAIPELVVDGVTGRLVPPGDVRALVRALVTYAQRRDLRLAHGRDACIRAAKHFNINDCAQAYLELFGELIERSARSRRSQLCNG